MSGDSTDLWRDVMSEYNGPLISLVSELLYLLLTEQYIIPSSDAHKLNDSVFEDHLMAVGTDLPSFFHVLNGSGMGLQHSAIVANTSFFVRCEKPFLGQHLSYSIRKYGRYFDDILILCSVSATFHNFVAEMRSIANHFKLLCSNIYPR